LKTPPAYQDAFPVSISAKASVWPAVTTAHNAKIQRPALHVLLNTSSARVPVLLPALMEPMEPTDSAQAATQPAQPARMLHPNHALLARKATSSLTATNVSMNADQASTSQPMALLARTALATVANAHRTPCAQDARAVSYCRDPSANRPAIPATTTR
jgi:hypothetical protein